MLNTETIKVTSCGDCPFYMNDSDEGASCYEGVDLNTRDMVTIVKGNRRSTLPKLCPLLTKKFTIELDR